MIVSRITFFLLPFIIFLPISTLHFCSALETITSAHPIRDSENITSSNGIFKLGFFSPGNSSNRYVGIWYNKIPGELTIVWVANRDAPLRDASGVFTIGDDHNLVVLDGKQNMLWTSNVSNVALSSHAVILDTGNLVLREGNSSNSDDGSSIWQSFNYPSNTFLPDMKLGVNKKTGEKQIVTSWKSDTDPSPGNFLAELDPVSNPQIIIKNGSNRYWRSGPWNGVVFIGVEGMNSNYLNGFSVVRDDEESTVYMTFSYANKSILVRYVLNSQGTLVENVWDEGDEQWVQDSTTPQTECEIYGSCGAFAFCETSKPPSCSCLKGFEPNSIKEWNKGNWSGGCVRRKQLQCERSNNGSQEAKNDGFLKLQGMKVPDFANWIKGWDLKQCEESCFSNCSCIVYAYESGTGCMWWSGNLIDIEKFSNDGVDLFIRVDSSELEQKSNVKVILISTAVVGVLIICVLAYIVWRWMEKQGGKKKKGMEVSLFDKSGDMSESADSSKLDDNPELPIFSLEKLMIATNNFDSANKLGQGGFGPVYQGILRNGREIAVKRLSNSSGQGSEEFKNEVVVISKLQHNNLVRLLGCCAEGEEKMLVYEYMPNKSLDAFIFDPSKKHHLDWRKRFDIIIGICRGILYLHRDSRLKVIHRDLKASNILLDQDMNPKISDFGMARIFSGNEFQANTMRVVGTYGYMSPEYAMEGLFSEKSDVFSFGVLLLELVSGQRNNSFYRHENSWSLIGYAWTLWNEGKTEQLIDPVILGSSYKEEILRCIQVGLLCVQDFAKDRPIMSSVVSMLTSEITSLPNPKQPAFAGGQIVSDSDSSQNNHKRYTNNNVSITAIEGR